MKKVLNKKTMEKKHDLIKCYLESIFSLTNESLPSMTKANIIGSLKVLETLKDLEKVVEEDINSLKLNHVDVEDILGERKKGISNYIYLTIYNYGLHKYFDIKKTYEKYLKITSLEDIYPLEQRKLELEDKNVEIKKVEEIILRLDAAGDAFDKDISLAFMYKAKLINLKREYDELSELIEYKTIEDIQLEIYNLVHYKMRQLLTIIKHKIEYLERVMEI